VVEDEESVRRAVCRVLDGEGYHVLCSSTPIEAIQLASDPEAPVDLLLTDFHLPGASGYQLAGVLLQLLPGLRVVVMSGDAEGNLPEPPPGGRRLPHIMKPFSLNDLLELVRTSLEPPAGERTNVG
jgi:CheY-like chemotaxis protein